MIQIPKDAQQVFDTVLAHARAQGCRSTGAYYSPRTLQTTTICRYRAGGNKCFAGCLIPDSAYNVSFEGMTWTQLVAQQTVSEDNMELIGKLQLIHDYTSPDDWERKFEILAKEEGLKYNGCNSL